MGYVGKIQSLSGTGPIAPTLFGTCETAADTAAKVVDLNDVTNLLPGMSIRIKFKYSNTAADPTLKVEGTSALPIYLFGTTAPGTTPKTSWYAGAILSLTYVPDAAENGAWIVESWQNDDTTYENATTSTAGLMSASDKVLLNGLNKPISVSSQSVLANSWVGQQAPYYADVPVLGATTSHFAIAEFNALDQETYRLFGPHVVSNGSIRIFAHNKPSSSITVKRILLIR